MKKTIGKKITEKKLEKDNLKKIFKKKNKFSKKELHEKSSGYKNLSEDKKENKLVVYKKNALL